MDSAINVPRSIFCLVLIAVVAGLLMIAGLSGARGQEAPDSAHTGHPPEDILMHEKFYKTWNRPNIGRVNGLRTYSCCDKRDCYPTTIKNVGGTWMAQRREDGTFIPIPDNILEQKQDDEVEAPDGQSHVCMNPAGMVFCATIGSGQ